MAEDESSASGNMDGRNFSAVVSLLLSNQLDNNVATELVLGVLKSVQSLFQLTERWQTFGLCLPDSVVHLLLLSLR